MSGITIGRNEVRWTDGEGAARSAKADHVIVAKGATGDTSLADALREHGFNAWSIGDANGVGYIEGAMESAAELAVQLS